MGMSQVGDSRFALAVICWIRQNEFLSDRHFRGQHHQGAMRADGDRERFFKERAMVGRFAADDDRQVDEHALAASLRCLRQVLALLLFLTIPQSGAPYSWKTRAGRVRVTGLAIFSDLTVD